MTKPSEGVETMDDATPEESKPKGIKPANLTAIIIAAVAVALSGIGGGYATGRTTNRPDTTRRSNRPGRPTRRS